MLASAPRAGSTYLASLMWESDVLGAPLEYLNFEAIGEGSFRDSGLGLRDYWADIERRRTSPNGLFSWKMFVRMYRDVLIHDPQALELLSADACVYLTRRDLLAQAVSYWWSINTGAWYVESKEGKVPSYNYQAIREAEKSIINQMKSWERFFARYQPNPTRVYFEDIINNAPRVIEIIAKACQVQTNQVNSRQSRQTKPQVSDLKAEITKIYKAERLLQS